MPGFLGGGGGGGGGTGLGAGLIGAGLTTALTGATGVCAFAGDVAACLGGLFAAVGAAPLAAAEPLATAGALAGATGFLVGAVAGVFPAGTPFGATDGLPGIVALDGAELFAALAVLAAGLVATADFDATLALGAGTDLDLSDEDFGGEVAPDFFAFGAAFAGALVFFEVTLRLPRSRFGSQVATGFDVYGGLDRTRRGGGLIETHSSGPYDGTAACEYAAEGVLLTGPKRFSP